MYAYRILTKEVDGAADKGYCPALYEGISVCEKERHLHISSDEKYILGLIERAEPELAGRYGTLCCPIVSVNAMLLRIHTSG